MSSDPPSKKEHFPPSSKSKIIKKGKASLFILNGESVPDPSGKPQCIDLEPRKIKKSQSKNLAGQEDVGEIVERLDRNTRPRCKPLKLDKVKFEKLKARPDEEDIQEEKWKSTGIPGWWVAAAGTCAVILLLSGLAIESWLDGDVVEEIESPLVLIDPHALDENDPEYWFQKRAGRMGEDATRLLESYMSAKDDVQKSIYTRNPKAYLEESKKNAVNISPRLKTIDAIGIDHRGEMGYLTVSFKDQDFRPLTIYFTHEGEDLKIDWRATTAWSEVSLVTIKKETQKWYEQSQNIQDQYVKNLKRYQRRNRQAQKRLVISRMYTVVSGDTISRIAKVHHMSVPQLKKLNKLKNDVIRIGQKLKLGGKQRAKPGSLKLKKPKHPGLPLKKYREPVLVRCLLTRRDEFYAGAYSDHEYSAYLLLSKDATHSMWGYVKRGSKLDLELRGLLDHGRFILDLKKNLRVALHLKSAQEGALPNQLEVVDLAHLDWVAP